MARVPSPQPGQPLDLSYIATLADAVNQLSDAGSVYAQSNNFILKGRLNDTPASYKLYGAQVFAQEIIFASGTSDTLEQTVSFSPYNFANPPIVSATLVDPSNASATVSLKNVTSGSVTVIVKFPTSQNNKTAVSILAIGMPSNVS